MKMSESSNSVADVTVEAGINSIRDSKVNYAGGTNVKASNPNIDMNRGQVGENAQYNSLSLSCVVMEKHLAAQKQFGKDREG